MEEETKSIEIDNPNSILRYTSVKNLDKKKKKSDFKEKYNLQCKPDANNKIKIFFIITMYNENMDELYITLKALCKNLEYFKKKGINISKESVLCIVSDGKFKISDDVLNFFEYNNIFDRSLMDLDNISDTQLHLFENEIQFKLERENKTFIQDDKLHVIFALKEKNAGKLDSHQWFFNSFCQIIEPEYCILIDVGTKPNISSIFLLYDAMEQHKDIGGCCGEIAVNKPTSYYDYFNPIVASQLFEYKLSNILDKSLESLFGYITVLPGAFSAYRYKAIGYDTKESPAPLVQYFKGIDCHDDLNAFESNMFLAEDRILCFEIISRKKSNWKLRYIKNSVAKTDVPTSIDVFIKQRRRWLNGSLFALLYALLNIFSYINKSGHTWLRKFMISLQYFYFLITLFFTLLLPANFYLVLYFVVGVAYNDVDDLGSVFSFIRYIFIFLTLTQIIIGLGNSPSKMKNQYMVCALFYGFIMYAILFFSIKHYIINEVDILIITALAISVSIFFIAALIHGIKDFILVCITFFQYLFMLPSFIYILQIYSYCNIHDISWGTKGIDQAIDPEKQAKEDKFKQFRSYILIIWICMNGLFISIITFDYDNNMIATTYLKTIFVFTTVLNALRFIGSVLFAINNKLYYQGTIARYANKGNKENKESHTIQIS